jgi:hypothetical protein
MRPGTPAAPAEQSRPGRGARRAARARVARGVRCAGVSRLTGVGTRCPAHPAPGPYRTKRPLRNDRPRRPPPGPNRTRRPLRSDCPRRPLRQGPTGRGASCARAVRGGGGCITARRGIHCAKAAWDEAPTAPGPPAASATPRPHGTRRRGRTANAPRRPKRLQTHRAAPCARHAHPCAGPPDARTHGVAPSIRPAPGHQKRPQAHRTARSAGAAANDDAAQGPPPTQPRSWHGTPDA